MHSRFSWIVGAAGFVLIALGLHASNQPARAMQPDATADATNGSAQVISCTVWLPVLSAGDAGDFMPTQDRALPAGNQRYRRFIIPAGVTITADADTRNSADDILISGTLAAPCHALELSASTRLSVIGTLANGCDDAATPAGITLASRGALAVGAPGITATLTTSGALQIGNAPSVGDWEFALPQAARSAQKMAPVCAASASVRALDAEEHELLLDGRSLDPDGGPVTYSEV